MEYGNRSNIKEDTVTIPVNIYASEILSKVNAANKEISTITRLNYNKESQILTLKDLDQEIYENINLKSLKEYGQNL